ncbi:hypothetical protein PLESTB_000730000 [Pleodorina starrii]|uniref:J domain-containing protein n=1 Tax=Pleodorina starrii TaxID=330485 RepID=A0A9W6BKL7_9CHLO|nr:hypothetical protein PLESTM_000194000 [Pleodorina starrii]GLC53302.1 hypothetical protein PLESTB_000730000 [Pleodorina starrii]GLC67229.1 hypothetical protein PLESTF_000531300 [Pleodorina starrii]
MQRACFMERIPRPRTSTTTLRSAPVSRSSVAVKCCFMAASRTLSLSSKCPYRTLGIRPDADEETIKVAYRCKVKQMHPDASGDPMTANAFMDCQSAYKTLLNPEKRAKYDKTLQPRANSQALSYLNALSAARHGIVASRVPSRASYHDRPQLYKTMLVLLAQAKSCTKHLEQIVGKDGVVRGLTPVQAAAAASSSRPNAAPPRSAAVSSEADCDCGDHECCEPWIYYAAQPVTKKEKATPAGIRRRN